MNVYKTFRRRPERLLNILCTFNLRPASTGTCDSSRAHIKWNLPTNLLFSAHFWIPRQFTFISHLINTTGFELSCKSSFTKIPNGKKLPTFLSLLLFFFTFLMFLCTVTSQKFRFTSQYAKCKVTIRTQQISSCVI